LRRRLARVYRGRPAAAGPKRPIEGREIGVAEESASLRPPRRRRRSSFTRASPAAFSNQAPCRRSPKPAAGGRLRPPVRRRSTKARGRPAPLHPSATTSDPHGLPGRTRWPSGDRGGNQGGCGKARSRRSALSPYHRTRVCFTSTQRRDHGPARPNASGPSRSTSTTELARLVLPWGALRPTAPSSRSTIQLRRPAALGALPSIFAEGAGGARGQEPTGAGAANGLGIDNSSPVRFGRGCAGSRPSNSP